MSFANIRKVARHLGSCVIRLASEYAPVVALEASGSKRNQAEASGSSWNQAKASRIRQSQVGGSGSKQRAAKDGSEAAETLVTLSHQCVHWPG